MNHGETGEAEDSAARGEATTPATRLNHEQEFERAWTDPRNTRIELPPVDINLVLARYYRTSVTAQVHPDHAVGHGGARGVPARPLYSFRCIGW